MRLPLNRRLTLMKPCLQILYDTQTLQHPDEYVVVVDITAVGLIGQPQHLQSG